jgi:hypothetical protein
LQSSKTFKIIKSNQEKNPSSGELSYQQQLDPSRTQFPPDLLIFQERHGESERELYVNGETQHLKTSQLVDIFHSFPFAAITISSATSGLLSSRTFKNHWNQPPPPPQKKLSSGEFSCQQQLDLSRILFLVKAV